MSETDTTTPTTAREQAEITKSAGLHVRPAQELSGRAEEFSASIEIWKDSDGPEKAVNAESIMELLSLGAGKGTILVIRAKGSDAKQAASAIAEFIKNAGS